MSFLILIAIFGIAIAQECNIDNCKLPDCRCYVDNNPPGNIALEDIPQMVVITMDYSLNEEYREYYEELFQPGITNPNGCKLKGTFFIQDEGTSYDVVKLFADEGFEIGVNSVNGQIPADATAWELDIKDVKQKIANAGINGNDIRGSRAPQLTPGGDDQLIGIGLNDMLYEASCVTTESLQKWAYTFDFENAAAKCNSGKIVSQKFPGRWQVLLPEFEFNGERCASPQSCSSVSSKQDAFDILYNNFAKHYDAAQGGLRTPYVITIDPSWMKDVNKKDGTVQFIEYVRAAFDDVWVVSAFQMLQWVQNPVPVAELPDFDPWKC